MNESGIKGNEWGSECGKKSREVKKRERCFTLLPSLLHPVLIDTEALKEMSAWTECVRVSMCVCRCIHSEIVNTYLGPAILEALTFMSELS